MDNGRDAARTVLCVDVGNSDTNLGLFVGGELEATWKVTTTERMTADEARMRGWWARATMFGSARAAVVPNR